MKVIVTGGRDYQDFAMVQDILSTLSPDFVIQGGASGADAHARTWAEDNNVELATYTAKWDEFGRAAGPFRNNLMLKDHPDALVLAFPGGRGTANCVRQAKEMNMMVLKVEA